MHPSAVCTYETKNNVYNNVSLINNVLSLSPLIITTSIATSIAASLQPPPSSQPIAAPAK